MSPAHACCCATPGGPASCDEVACEDWLACYRVQLSNFRKLHLMARYAGTGANAAFNAAGQGIAPGTPLWWAWSDVDWDIDGEIDWLGRDSFEVRTEVETFPSGTWCESLDGPCTSISGLSVENRWGTGGLPTYSTEFSQCLWNCSPLAAASLTGWATRRVEVLVDHRLGSATAPLCSTFTQTDTVELSMPVWIAANCIEQFPPLGSPTTCHTGGPWLDVRFGWFYRDGYKPSPWEGCTVSTDSDAWIDYPAISGGSCSFTTGTNGNVLNLDGPSIDGFRGPPNVSVSRPRSIDWLVPLDGAAAFPADVAYASNSCRSWGGNYNGTPPTSVPASVSAMLSAYPSDWNSYQANVWGQAFAWNTPTLSISACP